MEIERLIEQMKWWAEECDRTNFGCQAKKTLQEGICGLSTLQAENERLKSLLGENGQDLWSKENQRADRLEAELEIERTKHQLGRCLDCRNYEGLAVCKLIGDCGGTNFFCGWFEPKTEAALRREQDG